VIMAAIDDDLDDFDLDGALEQSLAQMEVMSPGLDERDAEEKKKDEEVMKEALNAVQQSISNAADAKTSTAEMINDDEMKDFFNEIFKSFSSLEDDASDESLDAALKKVMTQFFDSAQLKEPVEIICTKYPQWLQANRETLSATDYDNYVEQYKLYKHANLLLQAKKPNTSKIMDLLLKTFSYGSLPPEVMDGMMPDELKQFADQMALFEKDIDKGLDKNKAEDKFASTDAANAGAGAGAADAGDMNSAEAMQFFQQLMGMQNANNGAGPDLSDLPKLDPQEMEQFKQLMNQDGCAIM